MAAGPVFVTIAFRGSDWPKPGGAPIKGTYVSIEPFHLFLYLDEQCFRFNNRKLRTLSGSRMPRLPLPPPVSPDKSPYERFTELGKKLMAVPKSEIDERDKAWEEARKRCKRSH